MKRYFVFIFLPLTLLVSACGDDSETPLEGFADADSVLVRVLIDLHRVDANAFVLAREAASESDAGIAGLTFTDLSLRDSVLSAHGLDEISFSALIEEQILDPERFLATYNRVLDLASVQDN